MMTKGGGGVKNLKKLMTSFMNGPLYEMHAIVGQLGKTQFTSDDPV